MPFTMNLWRIADEQLHEVPVVHLDFEKRLEQWIVDNPSILGLDLLIIGNQVLTEFGGRVDLLALTRDGETVVIELKRDRTPRDIVA